MKRNGLAALAAAALLAGSGLLAAQDSGDDIAQAESEEPPAASPSADTSTPAETTQAPRRDPFDYESSEQISEDLSVSFPVDI